MLKVIPRMWSYTFSVMDGQESVAQAVDLSWWRDKGELRIQDAIYTARRDRSSYVLESAAGVLARTERPRKWRRELIVVVHAEGRGRASEGAAVVPAGLHHLAGDDAVEARGFLGSGMAG